MLKRADIRGRYSLHGVANLELAWLAASPAMTGGEGNALIGHSADARETPAVTSALWRPA
jgi:hypothetical protein